ncbi:MAG: hypothetical protein IT347_10705 [Candidatus Eisenbacteria bacterium]|nr:hypothetical protein [Candidatus Eisenbacteria bacterium]
MKRATLYLAALLGLVPTLALAHGENGHAADPNLHVDPGLKDCSVDFAPGLTQVAFRRFAREFGSASAFTLMAPPTTLGRGHVAFALDVTSFSVEEKADAWNDTFSHPDDRHELGSRRQFPKLRLRAGLSDRADLGVFYTANPNANYGWFGIEGRYALWRQDGTTPVSVVARGAWTKTLYVDDIDLQAATGDLEAGRTFWNVFTPYAGVGTTVVVVRETTDSVDLHSETLQIPHVLGGAELRWWRFSLGGEVRASALTTFEVQLATIF